MAHDENLARRFRALLGDRSDITEKTMMGGLCFFLNGNMLGGVRREKPLPGGPGQGHFLFRVGKAAEARALARPETRMVHLGQRRMGGFVYVAEKADEAVLKAQMALALAFVGGLPAKG